MLTALLKTMRPRQWTKNVFIFAALVFDKQLLNVDSFLWTLAGFALFCLISSSVYIFNDLADVEANRQHPDKLIKQHLFLSRKCCTLLSIGKKVEREEIYQLYVIDHIRCINDGG